MRALVYHGPGQKAWQEAPEPQITDDGDVIVRVDATTICGTDLHILNGDVPAVAPGRILGHEAVGTVEEVGDGVRRMRPGDITITTGLVDASSTPILMRLITTGQIDAGGSSPTASAWMSSTRLTTCSRGPRRPARSRSS